MKKILISFFLLCFIGINAQNNSNEIVLLTDNFYEITLKDGTKFKAQIYKESMDSLNFVFRTSLIERMRIPMSSITSIKEIKHSENKKIKISEQEITTKKEINSQEVIEKPSKTKDWISNPFATKYFFGVSAFPLKKNEIYYQNTLILSNSINFGISNNFSLGVGTILSENYIYLFTDFIFYSDLPYIYITPKLSYKINNFITLGCVSMFNYFNSYEIIEGLNYFINGMFTFGNENNNFSLGVGHSKILNYFEMRPNITLSGMLRLSNNFSLITDNFLIPMEVSESKYERIKAYQAFSTVGFRYFREKVAIDIGILNSITNYLGKYHGKNHLYFMDYFILPYIDFVVKF